MTPDEDVKGNGFDILGHKEPKEPRHGQKEEGSKDESHSEVHGEGFDILDHEKPKPSKEVREDAAGPRAEADVSGEEAESSVPLDVYSVLRLSIAQFAGVAWQMMGLQPDPFTKEMRKDSVQARIAIDAAAALFEQLKPQLKTQEVRDYQNLLNDLRLNFISHFGEDSSGE